MYEEGPGYTAMLLGQPIGAAGVSILRPGVGEAWAIFSPLIKTMPFAIHRNVKKILARIIAEQHLRRVHAAIDPQDKIAVRWIGRLGFQREGTLRRFGEGGKDMDLYARI